MRNTTIYTPNKSQLALESVFEEIYLLGLDSVEKIKKYSDTHKTNLWERLEVALYDFICTGTSTSKNRMLSLDEKLGQSNVSKESRFGDYNHDLYLKFMGRIASDSKSVYAGKLWLDVLFGKPYSSWIPFIRTSVNNELTGKLRKHSSESPYDLFATDGNFYTLGTTLSHGLSPEDEIFEEKLQYSLKLMFEGIVDELYPDRIHDLCSYAYNNSDRSENLPADISTLSPEALYQKSLDLLEDASLYASLSAYRTLPAIGLHTLNNRFYNCDKNQLEKEIKNSKRRANTKARNVAKSLSLSL